MLEETLKTSKSYSLDPTVISWVMQKAARLTVETGERTNDSKLVNDILTAAMEADVREEARKIKPLDTAHKIKAVRS